MSWYDVKGKGIMDMCEIVKILNHNTILVLKDNEEIINIMKEE